MVKDVFEIYSKKTFQNNQVVLDEFLDPYVSSEPVVVIDRILFRRSDNAVTILPSVIEKGQYILGSKINSPQQLKRLKT